MGLVLCLPLIFIFNYGCSKTKDASSLPLPSIQEIKQISIKSELSNADVQRLQNVIVSSPDENIIGKAFKILTDSGIKIKLNQLKYLKAIHERVRNLAIRVYFKESKSITLKEKKIILKLFKEEKDDISEDLILRTLAKFDAFPKDMMSQVSLESDYGSFRYAAAKNFEKKETLTKKEIEKLIAHYKIDMDGDVSDTILLVLVKLNALAKFKTENSLASENWRIRRAAAHAYKAADKLLTDPDEKALLLKQLKFEDEDVDGISDVKDVIRQALEKHGVKIPESDEEEEQN